MMNRFAYVLDDTFKLKTHICTERNVPAVVANMNEKGSTPVPTYERKGYFEPGGYGMRATNFPSFDIEFLGCTLQLDADKIIEVYTELQGKQKPDFSFAENNFYICYSRLNVLVLDGQERNVLLNKLEEKLAEANAVADKFINDFEISWAKSAREHKEKTGEDFPIVRVKPTNGATN